MDTKQFLTSRTIIGLLMVLLPTVADWLGFQLPESVVEELGPQVVAMVENIWTAAGAALAIYGRIKATKRLRVV